MQDAPLTSLPSSQASCVANESLLDCLLDTSFACVLSRRCCAWRSSERVASAASAFRSRALPAAAVRVVHVSWATLRSSAERKARRAARVTSARPAASANASETREAQVVVLRRVAVLRRALALAKFAASQGNPRAAWELVAPTIADNRTGRVALGCGVARRRGRCFAVHGDHRRRAEALPGQPLSPRTTSSLPALTPTSVPPRMLHAIVLGCGGDGVARWMSAVRSGNAGCG